jgi:hypothetical protein
MPEIHRAATSEGPHRSFFLQRGGHLKSDTYSFRALPEGKISLVVISKRADVDNTGKIDFTKNASDLAESDVVNVVKRAISEVLG